MNTSSEHYLHHRSYNHRERIVGLFVFSGFVLFLFFILISVKNQHIFEKRVKFYVDVNSSEGISPGNIVKALGTEVGMVSGLSLAQDQKIRVAIEVYEGKRKFIREDSTALVNRLTSIGNALIEIESESINGPMLAPESIIPVQETPSLNDLLLDIANLIQTANNKSLLGKFEEILPKVEESLANVHNIISQIATGHGVLGAAIFDQQVEKELKVVVKSGAEILSEAEGIIGIAKQRLVQLEPVLDDAQFMTKDLRDATHDLPEMVKELNEIIIQAQAALTLVNGELKDMPGVALDAKRTLSKTGRLLDSVQNTWPLSKNNPAASANKIIAPQASYD